MPTRTLTDDEAAEYDSRKNLRALRNVWENKAVRILEVQALATAARKEYEAARAEHQRLFGNAG
jgi:hypothetical protein